MSDQPPQITNRRPLSFAGSRPERPMVIAHRGASAEKPENTLAAFRRALALGVDGIELDVHVTRDGVVVVFHDDELSRLTGVRGQLAAKTWRELSVLRIRGSERIPKLVEVLRLTRNRAVVQIEIKAGVPVAPVVRAVKAAKAMKDVVLASFAPDIVGEACRLAPTIPRMLISEGRGTPASTVGALAACHANGLSVNQRAIRNPAYLRYFHRRGYAVWTWTVNETHRMRTLAEWGIDGILSDNPALLTQVV
jgi:glycerophosphoryl diester phosphodiesterase